MTNLSAKNFGRFIYGNMTTNLFYCIIKITESTEIYF